MNYCDNCLDWLIGFFAIAALAFIMIIVDGIEYRKLRDKREKLQIENMILKSKGDNNDTK